MSYEKRYNVIDLNPNIAVGIKIPFLGKTGRLFDLSYSTEEQAISNLKNLLLTSPGERIMEPLFGTRIKEFLFEQNVLDAIESLKTSIESAVDFWLPYISIQNLEITPAVAVGNSKDEHGVEIVIQVSVNNTGANTKITLFASQNLVGEV